MKNNISTSINQNTLKEDLNEHLETEKNKFETMKNLPKKIERILLEVEEEILKRENSKNDK